MKTLDQLAVEHKTDKCVGYHGYTATYERHLGPMRHSATAVFEIGVHHGGSIRMWRDYFHNAVVHGMDIKPYSGSPMGERVVLHLGDQNCTPDLLKVAEQHGPFDLVIDDGSHENESQWKAFEVLWPHVKPGGYLIVEDTCCSYWKEYSNGWPPGPTAAIEKFMLLVHDVNFRGYRVGRDKARDATLLLDQPRENMPVGMYLDIDEIVFANSTVLLRKRK